MKNLNNVIEKLQKGIKNNTPPVVAYSTNDAAKARLAQYIISGFIAKIESGKELDDIDFDIIIGMNLQNGLIDNLKLRNGINPNEGNTLDWFSAYNLPLEYKFPWE